MGGEIDPPRLQNAAVGACSKSYVVTSIYVQLKYRTLEPHKTHSDLMDTRGYFKRVLLVVFHSSDYLTVDLDLVSTYRVPVMVNTVDCHLS
jgi:hypothetical protein